MRRKERTDLVPEPSVQTGLRQEFDKHESGCH
jgi:hypothetical protein